MPDKKDIEPITQEVNDVTQGAGPEIEPAQLSIDFDAMQQSGPEPTQAQQIVIPGIDPQLNPNSPEFDAAAWHEWYQKYGPDEETKAQLLDFADTLTDKFGKLAESLQEQTGTAMDAKTIAEAFMGGVSDAAAEMAKEYADIYNAGCVAGETLKKCRQEFTDTLEAVQTTYKALQEYMADVADRFTKALQSEEFKRTLETTRENAQRLAPLFPYIQIAFKEMNPDYPDDLEPDDISLFLNADGEPTDDSIAALLERARELQAEHEAGEANQNELPRLQPLRPDRHTMPNNALMNVMIAKAVIDAPAFDLTVINADKKMRRKEVSAWTMISYEGEDKPGQEIASKLTEYERQVSDAIVSLWIEADKKGIPPLMTAEMIFREMPGGNDSPSPQQKGAVTKTMAKFRKLDIKTDVTDVAVKYGVIGTDKDGNPLASMKYDENYLNIRGIEVTAGGITKTAYLILSEPLIYKYAKMTNQLLTIPSKYIEIKNVQKGTATTLIAMSKERQAITGYMARRVATMKHDREKAMADLRKYRTRQKKDKTLPGKSLDDFIKLKPVILFDTVFNDVGITSDNRTTLKRYRDFMISVCDYWIVEGFIKGYSVQKKKSSAHSIVFDL